MNTEIQRGSVRSSTLLTPNGSLRGEVDHHSFWAMLVPGRFSSGLRSSKRELEAGGAAGPAGEKLSEEPEDDEHNDSERLGAE